MSQIKSNQPGDIVVTVPRWIIGAVGTLALLLGLGISFLLITAGLVSDGVLFGLAVLVCVPVSLLLLYVLWRLFWVMLCVALLALPMVALAWLSQFSGQQLPAEFYSSKIGSIIVTLSNSRALNNTTVFLFAIIAVVVVGIFYRAAFGQPAQRRADPDHQRPRRKRQVDLWNDE